MICKIKSRADFSGVVNYANDIKAKSARVIGSNGVLLVSNRTIAYSFESQLRIPDADGRIHRLSKPVKHISIAFSPKDAERFPDNEEGDRFMEQIAREWIQEMGIDPGILIKTIRTAISFSTALPTTVQSYPTSLKEDVTRKHVSESRNATD